MDNPRSAIGKAGHPRHRLIPTEIPFVHTMRGVPLESIQGLLDRCPLVHLAAGEILLEADQDNQNMYLVISGTLNVHLETLTSEPVTTLEAGQTVGELSVIDHRRTSAFVVAAEYTRLLAMDEDTFWWLVMTSHEFSANLLVLFASRMRTNNTVITKNDRIKRHFEEQARIDGLTGLHNRRWLDEALVRLVDRNHRQRDPLSLIVIDIDHFKKFNDTYGHDAGDNVIVAVARTLIDKLRPTDLGARFGGEEFVMALPHTDLNGAMIAAERLRAAVEQAVVTSDAGEILPRVTISCGVSELKADDNAKTFLKRADECLYQAKQGGRNRCCG